MIFLKKWWFLFLIILFIPYTTACSPKQQVTKTNISEKDTVVTKEIGQPIENLERFAKFLQRYEKGEKDSIRIITLSPEGESVPNDLSFDGTYLKLQLNSYTYTGTKLVKKEDGDFITYEMQLKSDIETYFPIIYLPK
ncbi:MAG TPA: hypothetical protein DDY49_11250 [Paenibacillaceae bacterium]|nr:hypothetical protein [Paenibacillaceae bacterium]